MLRKQKWIPALVAGLMLFGFAGPVIAAETTITGTVKETFEIEAEDGTLYFIDETDTGFDLMAHEGKKMQVTGEVTEDADMKIITVTSFKAVE